MRILWFTLNPSCFNPNSNNYNGGGWTASLEQIVRNNKNIELGIAFKFPDYGFKYENDGVSYYPIKTVKRSLVGKLLGKSEDKNNIIRYLEIIDDFKPDLIQIFGSENEFGAICSHTKIPVVIHMQGCIPPYHNALFPVGMKKSDFLFKKGLSLSYRIIGLRSEKAFRKRAEMEIETIQSCRYFMGRTEWDKSLIELFNPDAAYFHCEEALRDSFINSDKRWEYTDGKKKTIISVISRPWYKGCDLILKTAALLKRFTDIDFEWKVYGIPEMKFYESVYGIKAEDVNVHPMGTASKDELVDALCSSSCYVHPSYIDNSPNSICEAQILGVPVLATNVGGIASIVKNGVDGILFPTNAPYTAAALIKRITADKDLSVTLSSNAIKRAIERHNPTKIGDRLVEIYETIIS
ncbi:MAG: glycosyltransferase [Bacteroidaceae bacterium]|nr:glycosyltransferase [Bacteroidaceae bacterium]